MPARFALLALIALQWVAVTPLLRGEPSQPSVDFDKQIAPIFEQKCNRCHGATMQRGGLDMRSRPALLKGGNSGPAYKPGLAQKSLLVELIHFNEMPPKKTEPRVTPQEFELIKTWINAEAPAPK